MTTAPARTRVNAGIGESVLRPDGIPKVTGDFAFASDLVADGMLWGATRRSPYARARITALDTTPALAMAGVISGVSRAVTPAQALSDTSAMRRRPRICQRL